MQSQSKSFSCENHLLVTYVEPQYLKALMTLTLRSKIRGAALGVAIGDRMGMPVETYSPAKIKEVFPETNGRVDKYLQPRNHKWFKNDDNETTDDWDYTQATFEGLNAITSLDDVMPKQAAAHVSMFEKRAGRGCGGTTRKAMKALTEGKSWRESAPTGPMDGSGNGVAMKIMPVAASYFAAWEQEEFEEFIIDYTLMTHAKSVAVSTSFAMIGAYLTCFDTYNPSKFSTPDFISAVVGGSALGIRVLPETITDNVTNRLSLLVDYKNYTPERIITEFGGGGCYCYHSVPFSLMFFLRNPMSLESMYDAISAGGDTDSNGSMVGGLLGALHGESIFPSELIEGLYNKNLVLETADRFCDKFGF